jgi:SET domain
MFSRTFGASVEMVCEADGTCEASFATDHNHPECTVYMAPSTLGVDTSMGIYTGVPVEPGTVINFPEIAVPLLFREFGDHVEGYQDGVLWDRYIWEGHVMEIETYVETNRDASRSVFVPGVGCTVNSVMDMCNIESTHGSTYYTAGLHRSKDPGAGAFTPYHNGKTIASATLPAGAELFATYGDYWIPDIPGAQITLEPYLEEAAVFLEEEYYPFVRDHTDELTADMKQALWEFTTKDFPINSKSFSNLPRGVTWADIEKSVQAKIAKETAEDEEEENDTVVKEFIRKQSVRSVEWLKENGYCQDHLKPGRSTIPQAGFGAFAYRNLPKGTIVGYAPLVHVGLYGLDIWTVTVDEEKEDGPPPKKQYDLILNYSFGHPNSTVLLTPYGGGVNYINHGGKEKANVRVQWPNKELIAHKPEFLTRTPYDLSNSLDKIGLSFEYVALRDIAEGEEVFLDYGPDWEIAWEKHVASWKPVENATNYVHSTLWNETFFRTAEELKTNPYPPNLMTMCIESYSTDAEGKHVWLHVLRSSSYRVYCKVLERTQDELESSDEEEEEVVYHYTVELELDDGSTVTVESVSSDGIFLYDRAFSADWHLPNVFRHEMAMPDDVLPEAWRNGPPASRLP